MDATVIGIIISIIGLTVSTIISIWAIRVSRTDSRNAEIFDSDELEFSIAGRRIRRDDRFKLIVGGPEDKVGNHIWPFELTLFNRSIKSVEDVSIIIMYPRNTYIAVTSKSKADSFLGNNITRQISNNNHYKCISYSWTKHNPRVSVTIPDPLIFIATDLSFTTSATTKDNFNVNIKTKLCYSFEILASVSAKNMLPVQYRLDYVGLECDSPEDLAIKYWKKQIDIDKQNTLRFTFFDHIFRSHNFYRDALLIYPNLCDPKPKHGKKYIDITSQQNNYQWIRYYPVIQKIQKIKTSSSS